MASQRLDTPPAAPVRRVGRFELQRLLGRGAQATVWLAHDPRLQRDVAVKLLDTAGDAGALRQWLAEARAVSRLAHPNIVPVFEADEENGQPYLVFEYVDGPTLAEARRQRPAWPAREAASLLLGMLDALAAAHDQGIVHRDLKPSNVLLGRDGRPRVMDFGIAARVGGHHDAAVVGTPGYMSPEAARGEAPLPAMDVYAAGALLGELLCGAPLLRESDPFRAVQRVQHEDLVLPASAAVDGTLRGIVQRALARDPALRHDSARAMHAALSAWLEPAHAAPSGAAGAGTAAAGGGNGHGTLEFLLRRMRHKTDFPALSASVLRIQRVATSDTESLASLSSEILKDVALTNKLLRMVNTAHFTAAAGGAIGTVSRAVALVGFASIRNMALSLVLLEHMGDKAHAALLEGEFVRALMAGMLAGELTPLARDGEEAFLGSMFQNLGRLLTEYYFPEEAQQIRQQLPSPDAGSAAREAAATRVLGIGFDELGAGIARAWGLPEGLQRVMRPPDGDPPLRAAQAGVERSRWLGRVAAALTDALLSGDGPVQERAVVAEAERYAGVLGLKADDMLARVSAARIKLAQLTHAMGLSVRPGTPQRRLFDGQPARGSDGAAGAPEAALSGAAFEATVLAAPLGPQASSRDDPAPAERAPAAVAAHLRTGLGSVRQAIGAPTMRLNEVLQLVLRTMQDALDFRCTVFCLRDPKADALTGRFGVGADAAAVSAALKVPMGAAAAGDLFAAVCAKGADTLISDAAQVAARLPAWYRSAIDAPTFLLLPLRLKNAPFGLIYADKSTPNGIVLGDEQLALLKALRDQAVLAFGRQTA